MVAYLKTKANSHNEFLFSDIPLSEIRKKFELIKNLVSIFYRSDKIKNSSENSIGFNKKNKFLIKNKNENASANANSNEEKECHFRNVSFD